MIDGIAEHLAFAGDRFWRHLKACAMRAERCGWMEVPAAGRAAMNEQFALSTALPEGAVVGVECRKFSRHQRSAGECLT
ncbi:hypothetical protein D3C81_1883230 [compost metagenome]